jgi:hypothetical protein
MPRGTRSYGFKKGNYEYVEDGDNVAYGTGLCVGCFWRNRDVVAERREVVCEALEAMEAIKTSDVQRADDFVAAMRGLIDSFTKKAKKPVGEKPTTPEIESEKITIPLTKKQYEHFEWMFTGSMSQNEDASDYELGQQISFTKTSLTFPADRAKELAQVIYNYLDTIGVSSDDGRPSTALLNLSSKIYALASKKPR